MVSTMSFYDFYEKRKVTWINRILNKRFANWIASIVYSFVKSPIDSVLEIGAGKGSVAVLLNDHCDYLAVEPSPALCEYLSRKFVKSVNAFCPPIPCDDKSKDLIFSIHVIEHMKDFKAAVNFVSEIHRALKDHGVLILSFPDCRDYGFSFYDTDYSHNFITTLNRMRQLLHDCGFMIRDKSIFFGSSPAWIGLPCNVIVSALFLLINPIAWLLNIDHEKLYKLRNMFSKSYLVICEKNATV